MTTTTTTTTNGYVSESNDGKESRCRSATSRSRVMSSMLRSYTNNEFTLPKTGAYKAKETKNSNFRKFYNRGDFPMALEHDAKGNKISWKVDVGKLDYQKYLPLFFDGLCETEHPYSFFAKQGIHDMLAHGGQKVTPVIPLLIGPIKKALNTHHPHCICETLKVLQHLVMCHKGVGQALIPYYRQILPVLNAFKSKNVNTGDGIDYKQRRQENVGDLIEETLECMERCGGQDAYINIKYIVPTYESCLFR